VKNNYMKSATVREIQKNFARVLKNIKAGEEIIILRRGKPVAKITSLEPKKKIDWPDFYKKAVKIKGQPLSDAVVEEREDRF
jgi:prevent-host-death family protein